MMDIAAEVLGALTPLIERMSKFPKGSIKGIVDSNWDRRDWRSHADTHDLASAAYALSPSCGTGAETRLTPLKRQALAGPDRW